MRLRDRTNVTFSKLEHGRKQSKTSIDQGPAVTRRIIKAVRVFSAHPSGSKDFGSDPEFERAISEWMSPPDTDRQETEITFPSYNSVPPQPDFSLLLDFALADELEDFSIPVRNGCLVTKDTINSEHGSMEIFLNRLLAQMIKRRWFAALTEFNTTHLFGRGSPPSRFLKFLQLVHTAIEDAICADRELDPLWRAGRIKLVLKGGNCVALLKLQALYPLPDHPCNRNKVL